MAGGPSVFILILIDCEVAPIHTLGCLPTPFSKDGRTRSPGLEGLPASLQVYSTHVGEAPGIQIDVIEDLSIDLLRIL